MGYRVLEMRKEKKMSQEELAEKSGVSRTIIVALESGNEVTTTTTTLLKIANALDTTVDQIFFSKGV
jgi:transcriptional regulator with XRE-family HTH domain